MNLAHKLVLVTAADGFNSDFVEAPSSKVLPSGRWFSTRHRQLEMARGCPNAVASWRRDRDWVSP